MFSRVFTCFFKVYGGQAPITNPIVNGICRIFLSFWCFTEFSRILSHFLEVFRASGSAVRGPNHRKVPKKIPDQAYKPYSKLFFPGPWVFSHFLVFSRIFTCFFYVLGGLGGCRDHTKSPKRAPKVHKDPPKLNNTAPMAFSSCFLVYFSDFIDFSRILGGSGKHLRHGRRTFWRFEKTAFWP